MRPFILCAALGLELRFIMLTALPRFNASRRCTTSGSSRRHGRRPRSPEPNRITAIIKPHVRPAPHRFEARCSLLLVSCSSQCRVSVLYLRRGQVSASRVLLLSLTLGSQGMHTQGLLPMVTYRGPSC